MSYYALIADNEETNTAAAKEIDDAIAVFASTIASIASKYPGTGIGDTATDEEISEVVYSAIH